MPDCPFCKGSLFQPWLAGCHDQMYGLPGVWSFLRCQRCRSLRLEPQPTCEAISQAYPRTQYYTHCRVAGKTGVDTYAQSVKNWVAKVFMGYTSGPFPGVTWTAACLGKWPVLRRLVGYSMRFIPWLPDGRLLDVGCGNGQFMDRMRNLGWETTGVEIDPEAAHIGRVAGLDIRCGGILDQVFPEGMFDVICLNHVIEHLPEPEQTLQHLMRFLKGKGLMVCLSPNPESLLARLTKNDWYGLETPRHLFLPTVSGLSALLERVGLEGRLFTVNQPVFWHAQESYRRRFRSMNPRTCARAGQALALVQRLATVACSNLGEELVFVGTPQTR